MKKMETNRSAAGNVLKAVINRLYVQANDQEHGIAYLDMVRIADAVRNEGPAILGQEALPREIEVGLTLACATVSKDKESLRQHLTSLAALGTGTTGAVLVTVFLAQLVSPGIIAAAAAFFTGGLAGGATAPIGIAVGLALLVGSVYAALTKTSPAQRAQRAHDVIMNSIDRWMNADDASKPLEMSHVARRVAQAAALEVGKADGGFSEVERKLVEALLGGDPTEAPSFDQAVAGAELTTDERRSIASVAVAVAFCDGNLHPGEEERLRHVCGRLSVDMDALLDLHVRA